MRFIGFLFVALLFSINSFAQETVITGYAPGAERKIIQLTAPGDLITFWEKSLTEARIDSTGHFKMTVILDKTTFVYISIDFHKTELFLEPGQTYDLQIAAMNYDEFTEVNPLIQSQNLSCTISNPGFMDLNNLIGEFNSIYSGFLMSHFNALYRDRNKMVLDTFRVQLNQKYGGITNPYFVNYATYKLAALEQLTQYYSQAQLAKKYFSDKPVLYNNLEYMEFFNSFFSKYLTATSNIFRKIDLHPVLKSPDPYTAVFKVMAADTLLKNTRLRELVMLKGMMELYNNQNYNQDEVLLVITQTRDQSFFPENRIVAENMISLLTKLKPGTMAPEFTLISREIKDLSLKSLRGKPVVLSFWTTYCEGCLSEMELIKPLYETYKDKIHFVSVSADKYYGKMLFFINLKKDWLWMFVNVGEHSHVLKDYDVRTYPLFVLIDKEGRIVKYPAEQPSSGLEAELQKILKE